MDSLKKEDIFIALSVIAEKICEFKIHTLSHPTAHSETHTEKDESDCNMSRTYVTTNLHLLFCILMSLL